THHGDTDAPLLGHIMPDWDQVLDIGVKAAHMAKLGYVGVDIVLDKHHGPMLLEINARPGISIQIANRQGLKARISSMGL
ncbi:MAG TPA: alpha-L-glutamate ligase-like protein, partial [Rhodospirillaceae bacterium]|nr:alpha-L-glutamate ligase-like protein [Rhodospirillaceae bacterium]